MPTADQDEILRRMDDIDADLKALQKKRSSDDRNSSVLMLLGIISTVISGVAVTAIVKGVGVLWDNSQKLSAIQAVIPTYSITDGQLRLELKEVREKLETHTH